MLVAPAFWEVVVRIIAVGDVEAARITPPGWELLCVDMLDAGLAVKSGRLYVIRRTLAHGTAFETLVRRVTVYDDRTELVAEPAGDTVADTIVVPGRLTTDRSQEIFALGWVYGLGARPETHQRAS